MWLGVMRGTSVAGTGMALCVRGVKGGGVGSAAEGSEVGCDGDVDVGAVEGEGFWGVERDEGPGGVAAWMAGGLGEARSREVGRMGDLRVSIAGKGA